MTSRWLVKIDPIFLAIKVKYNAAEKPILYRLLVKNQNKYYYITTDFVEDCIEEVNLLNDQKYDQYISGRNSIELNDEIYNKTYNILDKLRKKQIILSNCHLNYIFDKPFDKIEFPYTGIDDIDNIDTSDELEVKNLNEEESEDFYTNLTNEFKDIVENSNEINKLDELGDYKKYDIIDEIIKFYLDTYHKLLIDTDKIIEKINKLKLYNLNIHNLPLPLINIIHKYEFPDINDIHNIVDEYINDLIYEYIEDFIDWYKGYD